MSSHLTVSIITVCLNAEESIEKTICSVHDQIYRYIEYVVIDGVSTDRTGDILTQYRSSITTLVSEEDSGVYDAMNKGIRHASGDIVYFLNADDAFYDEYVVEEIVREFEKYPDAGIVYGKVKFVNIPDHRKDRDHDKLTFAFRTNFELLQLIIPNQCVFARKAVFDQIGSFDTSYCVHADYDWFLRAAKNKIPMKFVERYTAYYNYQGLSYQTRNTTMGEKITIVFRNTRLHDFIVYFAFAACRKLKLLFNDYCVHPLVHRKK